MTENKRILTIVTDASYRAGMPYCGVAAYFVFIGKYGYVKRYNATSHTEAENSADAEFLAVLYGLT